MQQGTTNNGLSLGQHAFVFFISIVLSVALHFGLLYYCGEMTVSEAHVKETAPKVLPAELPPMHIERFVQQTHLVSADVIRSPDATVDASKVTSAIEAHVAQAKLSAPTTLPAPTLPTNEPTGDILESLKPNLDTLPDTLVRQEVVTVPETDVTQLTNPDPRWEINAAIPVVANAPDLAPTHDLVHGLPNAQPDFQPFVAAAPSSEEIFAQLTPLTDKSDALVKDVVENNVKEGMAEGLEAARDLEQTAALADAAMAQSNPAITLNTLAYHQIDDRLNLNLQIYQSPNDLAHNYFQLTIMRRPESQMPIMPKDVVFIQDISGSIGRSRLEYIKAATKSAIFNTLRAGDRFNIFAFRDVTLTPSSTWMTFNPDTRVRAEKFIDSLRARGNTDLFLLLQDLLTLPRDPKRPLIAVVVTDGEATAGVTETTRIIGEFSRMNQGNISVYTFDAKRRNPYFLDMLCYSNRGENTTASSATNLKELAKELKPVFESIRNPVMKDVTLSFDAASKGEVHPAKLTNLYADRALTIYGRVPRAVSQVTCQLRGVSSEQPYDAVFSFAVKNATVTALDLRKAWAERAMFDLLAEYAENPSPTLRAKINRFAKNYNVRDPYAEKP